MPRKRNNTPQNYNAPLPSQLRDLMRTTGQTQAKLATYLGVSRQSVSAYADGSANPTPATIVAIARFFNVSTDYLLGESSANSRDSSLQSVCQYTKLSEGAIKQILDFQETEALLDNDVSVSMTELLSMLLENPCFVPMLEDLQTCLYYISESGKNRELTLSSDREMVSKAIADLRNRTKTNFVILPDYELPNYYRSQVEDLCGQLITSLIEDYKLSLQDTPNID